jgi:hypothetical protein
MSVYATTCTGLTTVSGPSGALADLRKKLT